MSEPYSRLLYYTSFSMGASSMVSLFVQDYANSFSMFLLFLTSIYYWVRPDYGLRRDMDMLLCKVLFFYYYLMILYERPYVYSMIYLCASAQAVFLYLVEQMLVYWERPEWIVFHMSMHIQFSFMIPVILYVL